MVVEANLLENKSNWILDIGASRPFCSNRDLFHKFEDSTDRECIFMGNSTTAKTYLWKNSFVSNVLILSSFGRNLVFGNLLNRVGIRIVFEVDKVPISNLMNVSVPNSAYIVESIDVRHGRLSQVNFTSIKNKKIKK